MANPLNVTIDHLRESYGAKNLDPAETAWYEAKIDEAAVMLMAKRRNLVDRLMNGQLDPRVVVLVVIRAVERLLRNPRGLVSEADDGYSYQLSPTVASGDIWYPDTDLSLIPQPARVPVMSVRIRTSDVFNPVPPYNRRY